MFQVAHSRFLVLALILTAGQATFGQSGPAPDTAAGILPFSTHVGGQYDSIDPASGNVMISIPVVSKTGKIPFAFNLVGNFHAYVYLFQGQYYWMVPNPYFAAFNIGTTTLGGVATGELGATLSGALSTNCNEGALQFMDTSGATHLFPASFNVVCPNSGSAITTDGSGYTLTVTTTGQGTQQTLTNTIKDSSGNTLNVVASGATNQEAVYQVTDPDGVTMTKAVDTLGQVPLTATVPYRSGPNPSSAPDTYVYTDVAGNPQTVTVNYTQYPWKSNYLCSGVHDATGALIYFPSSVVLADGETFGLTYEVTPGSPGNITGRLAKLSLPTGGYITYTYSGGSNNAGIQCNTPPGGGQYSPYNLATIVRTVYDGNGHSSKWTYTGSANNFGNFTSTETDPLNDTITYYFSSANQLGEYETGRVVRDVNLGTLSTTVRCYNKNYSSQANCLSPSSSIAAPITQTDVYASLGSAATPSLIETQYDYDSSTKVSYGNVTAVKKWDLGATYPPSGSPISTTTTTYANIAGITCGSTSSYIHDRPCTVTTTNSAGSTEAQTKYTYNSTGHATQTSKWVSGTTYLNSSATYNPNGTIASYTDVNSAITNYYYNGTGGCNNLLLTSTVSPVNSLTTSQTWNCVGGVVTSTTDQNGQTTNYGYVDQNGTADPLWRSRSTTDPLANTTWNTYSPMAAPPTAETSMLFNSGASIVDELTTYDGLSRPIFLQTRQAPGSSNFDTVALTYDLLGRQASTSNPCVSTVSTGCSSPVTTTTYDALNRSLVVTDGGGGTRSYTYASNDTLVTVGPAPTGENVKKRQLEMDGLGRLTSVCEITSAPGSGTCAQVSSATGLWTEYAYDALGNLISVNQNEQGSPVQTRTYNYDGLSRLISEKNPEWSNVASTYTYDSDSAGTCSGPYNGDLVKKTDPAGNVTCLRFDGMHRQTSATYPSGPNSASTPAQTFIYDSTTFSCPTAPKITGNVGGQLAEAYTGSSSTKITDVGLCYSARGETTDVFESTPNSGGYYHTVASYWADGALNALAGYLASSSTFVPTQTYTPDGEGRWKSVAAASGPNPISATSYNAASQITGITYGSTDTDAFLYDSAGRMNKYTFTLNGSSEVSTPTWNANGTLQTLTITDPFNSSNAQTCTYAYDDLARITTANCGTPWSQTFSYDVFGNITKSGSISWQPGYNQSNNHYTLSGTSYDADGNLTNDSFHAYAWDSNGRPTSIGGKTMTYDALGRMVEKLDGGTYTQFAYSPWGALLAHMNGQSATSVRVPLPGSWAVYGSSSTFNHYEHTDWLGSSRLSSTQSRTMTSDIAYAPFGEPYASTATSGVSFTGMRSDVIAVSGGVTNGLYDFLARELPPTQGRWISPDPEGLDAADPTNPQSWNRYAYVSNSPLTATDPLGLDGTVILTPPNMALPGCNGLPICPGFLMDGDAYENYWQINAALGLLNSGAAMSCPNNDCHAFRNYTGSNGKQYKLVPGVDGPTWIAPNGEELDNPPTEVGLGFFQQSGRGDGPAQGQQPDTTITIPKDGGSTDRTFGPDGRAVKDIDSGHAHDPEPHAHDWDWSKKPPRQPRRELTPGEQKKLATTAKWVVVYWIVSEASRILFPPRNLVPVP